MGRRWAWEPGTEGGDSPGHPRGSPGNLGTGKNTYRRKRRRTRFLPGSGLGPLCLMQPPSPKNQMSPQGAGWVPSPGRARPGTPFSAPSPPLPPELRVTVIGLELARGHSALLTLSSGLGGVSGEGHGVRSGGGDGGSWEGGGRRGLAWGSGASPGRREKQRDQGPHLLPAQGSPPLGAPLRLRCLWEQGRVLFHFVLLEPGPALPGPHPGRELPGPWAVLPNRSTAHLSGSPAHLKRSVWCL